MKRLAAKLVTILLFVSCTTTTTRQPQISVVAANGPGGANVIRGTVRLDGNVLPGTTVVLIGNGHLQSAVTDPQGRYAFLNVASGTYSLRFELAGMQTLARSATVSNGSVVDVSANMRLAGVSESITVTAAPPPNYGPGGTTYSAGRISTWPTGYDAPPNAAIYTPILENTAIAAVKQSTTTFSIDVDHASYANVRRFLFENTMPPRDAVRIEEMINYFPYHYAQPADGKPFAVATEVAGCPWAPGHRLLRIGIQARTLEQWRMAPNNLVFLLDVSGSMMPPDRLPLLQSALALLVQQLRPQDQVAIVVYAGAAGLVLPTTSGADKTAILGALDKLQAGGSTNGGQGIELAYKVAKEHFLPDGNNRVILATDGDFNVGTSNIAELTNLIETKRKDGVYLTCLGVGRDNLNDALMESLADKGNGNYSYLDTIKEAEKVFVHELTGTLVSVADDVKVQLEFDPSVVASYRQIGYEDRALDNKDFEDDAKDAGDLGAGHGVTALYELVMTPQATPRSRIGTIRVRYKEPTQKASQLLTATIDDEGKTSGEATSDMQFAAAVAELGMLLRDSPNKGTATYADVLATARAMRGEDLEGYREELLRMIQTSQTLSGEKPLAVAVR